jgi:hypothetical protein
MHSWKLSERLLEVKVLLKSDMHVTERDSETMTTPAVETLTKQYGPLLSITQLAALLDRSRTACALRSDPLESGSAKLTQPA